VNRQQQIAQLELRTEYETLRNQVNPHFLFNSFNALTATIEEDPQAAVQYVQHLSDFFRLILEVRERSLVSLHEELQLAEHYLYLQQKRFGQNFSVINAVDESMHDNLLPPLTLQILLENAFKHNAVSRSMPLQIRITTAGSDLIVTNNVNLRPTPMESTGIGLVNVRNRLRLLGHNGMRWELKDGSFTVHVPLLDPATL
jgi:LytS/YehU family sensor histidine kinase